MSIYKKWLIFISERFNPIEYVIVIISLIAAHYYVATYFFKDLILINNSLNIFLLFFSAFIFFFKLRLLDEIKDYEIDKLVHPKRPLPRGLLDIKNVFQLIALLTGIELLLGAYYGKQPLIILVIINLYTYLMYKEFFISKWLKERLVLYAITHTLVISIFSLYVLSVFSKIHTQNVTFMVIIFALSNWFLFNIFEFGRKIYATTEEQRGVNSYTKALGQTGSVLLVIFMMILNGISLVVALKTSVIFIFIPLLTNGVLGIYFMKRNSKLSSKIYKTFNSMYILYVYVMLIITILN